MAVGDGQSGDNNQIVARSMMKIVIVARVRVRAGTVMPYRRLGVAIVGAHIHIDMHFRNVCRLNIKVF